MAGYHIMLDIETLGVNPNSPVLSIGVVDSDGKTYYRNLDVQSQIESGALPDFSTIYWWMHQDEEARASLHEFGIPVLGALQDLVTSFAWDKAEIWCNGASFDFPILDSLFRRTNMFVPWKYYQTRDLRTLIKLYPSITKTKPTIAHNALSDAEAQMATLMEILCEHKTRDLIQKQYREETASRSISDEEQQSLHCGNC